MMSVCLAGIEDWAVLSAHITGSRHKIADAPAEGIVS